MGHKKYSLLNILNRSNLNVGIKFWLEEKPKWGSDFHNDFYRHLTQLRSCGLTDEWWETMLELLGKWVALRPRTKKFIGERGQVRLHSLTWGYRHLLSKCQSKTPSNILLEWKDIEPLFSTAKDIKDVASPVFASKLCHFIVPGVFPVIDQEVLGGSKNYQEYWKFCRGLWQTTNNTENLIKVLSDKIGGDIVPDYPWTTKIVELCLIGQKASNS